MDEFLIRSGLRSPDHFHFEVFEDIDSTNLYVVELGKGNAPEWTVVVAEKQVRGRGRLDRNWESPAGVGLWFSILLRPKIRPDDCHLVNLLSAISLSEYLESKIHTETLEELNIGLKWPNDLYIKGKKLSGILLQSNIAAERINFLVLGIGLNVNQTAMDFPDDIREKAGSLRIATNHQWNREELLAGFLDVFYEDYYRLLLHKENIIELYMEKVLYMGENIAINANGETVRGIFKGLTSQGYLVLQIGERETVITTGEIS